MSLLKAREACLRTLQQFDKSSYILSAYIPSPARDSFIASRCFQVEVSRVTNVKSELGFEPGEFKISVWREHLERLFDGGKVQESLLLLLRDGLESGVRMDKSCFETMLDTKLELLRLNGFRDVDHMCSYGEGYYSQLNYLTQDMLLSEHISPLSIALVQDDEISGLVRDIAAHLGQGMGVASLVLGTKYYAGQGKVVLPMDMLGKNDLSQESVLRGEDLKDVVYDTCIVANDHLLTARSKIQQLQKSIGRVEGPKLKTRKWKQGVPDCIFVPFMTGVPLDGYLTQLQHNAFDLEKTITNPYWKLVWKTWRSYNSRTI